MSDEKTAAPEGSGYESNGGAEGTSAGETLSADAIAALKAQAVQGAEAQERFVRLYAEFENYKKRAARERDEARRAATEAMISRLLPVLDTFDMAMVAAVQPGTSVETLKAGVQMIQGQLRSIFAEQGLEEINAAGKEFDPALHDAVSQQETSEVPDGRILQQTRKGYRLKDRLLRPASVVVARAPGTAGDAGDGAGSGAAEEAA